MNTNPELKKVIKLFTVDDFEKEEEYLREMSLKGWHVLSVTRPGVYTFVKGEQKEYFYKLDYKSNQEDFETYKQLFIDAGWEYVIEFNGLYKGKWHYFRKEFIDGEIPDIFSDNESKIELYKRVKNTWAFLGVFLFFYGVIFVQCFFANSSISIFAESIIIILYFSVVGLYLKMFLKLTRKIRNIKSQ